MANTTFNGPVRSEAGHKVITKNTTTGAVSEHATWASYVTVCYRSEVFCMALVPLTGDARASLSLAPPGSGRPTDDRYLSCCNMEA